MVSGFALGPAPSGRRGEAFLRRAQHRPGRAFAGLKRPIPGFHKPGPVAAAAHRRSTGSRRGQIGTASMIAVDEPNLSRRRDRNGVADVRSLRHLCCAGGALRAFGRSDESWIARIGARDDPRWLRDFRRI